MKFLSFFAAACRAAPAWLRAGRYGPLPRPPAATRPLPKPPPAMRIDPTYWWVGMKNPKLQLLVHAPGIASSTASLAAYPGVTLEGTQKLESPNYLVVNLTISARRPARPAEADASRAAKS